VNETIPQFLTLDEVADRLRVNRRTIEREIQRGNFPKPRGVGRSQRVSVPEVLSYLERSRSGPASTQGSAT
jgi:excisionase family DNA binding protein